MRTQKKSYLPFYFWLLPLLMLLFHFYKKTQMNKPGMKEAEFRSSVKSLNLNEQQKFIILAVARHETGNFTSRLFLEQKNAFGMKPARKRKRYYKNELNGYANYSSLKDSLADFLDWWNWHKKTIPSDPTLAVRFMKDKNYFVDTFANYSKAVNIYYDEEQNRKY